MWGRKAPAPPLPCPPLGAGPFVPWGGEVHPSRLGPHYALLAQNQGGKTLQIRALAKACLLDQAGRLRHRVLCFAPKADWYAALIGAGIPRDQIIIATPFDARCRPWDLAQDVRTRAKARQLAAVLIPEAKETNPYFTQVARDVVAQAVDTLRLRGVKWTLSDVVTLCSSPKLLAALFEHAPPAAARRFAAHLQDNATETRANLVSTLTTKLDRYETVGALWSRSKEPFSLEDWATSDEPSVVVFGTYPEAASELEHINRAVFRRAVELTLAKEDYPPGPRTWFLLDELRLLGKAPLLSDLLLAGRSKHAHVVAGFQDVHGIMAVHGREAAAELLGQFQNFFVGRLSSPETREWASKFFGSDEMWRLSSVQSTVDGRQRDVSSFDLRERQRFITSKFFDMRPPRRGWGLEGVWATPFEMPYYEHLSPAFMKRYVPEPSSDPGLVPRPREEQDPPELSEDLCTLLDSAPGTCFKEVQPPLVERRGFEPSLPLLDLG